MSKRSVTSAQTPPPQPDPTLPQDNATAGAASQRVLLLLGTVATKQTAG